MSCSCSCGNKNTTLIYSCSGAANTGELADKVARKLSAQNIGSMTCLAALGADISGFKVSAMSSDKNIIIDGCPASCGKKIFESKKIPFEHFITTDFGVEKGKTKITDEIVDNVSKKIGGLV